MSASHGVIKKWAFPHGTFLQNMKQHNAVLNTMAINNTGLLASGADRYVVFVLGFFLDEAV